MSDHDNRIIDRMRKILELARRGVGGEQETAQAMLQRMLKKYGMTIEDLDPSVKATQRYQFTYTSALENKLLKQVIAKVLNTAELSYWRVRGSKTIELDLTRAEYAEIDLAYSIYRKALKKEVDRLLSAFIQTNRIFPDLPSADNDGTEMSLDELEALLDMMRGIKPTPITKMLEAA